MRKFSTIGLCLSLLVILSCSSSDVPCRNMDFRVLDAPYFSTEGIDQNQWEDLNMVINSKEELDQLIDAGAEEEAFLDIDFQSETLLIGQVRLTGIHGHLVNQSVQQCENSIVQYNLTVMHGGYQALGIYHYGIVVPKVNSSEVSFNIQTVEFDG